MCARVRVKMRVWGRVLRQPYMSSNEARRVLLGGFETASINPILVDLNESQWIIQGN